MEPIYLDSNASTPLLPAVWDRMRPFCFEAAANPASSHHAGRRARRALEDAREQVAHLLGALPEEVIFTSGATEANNLALFGLVVEAPAQILLSPIEHPCVIEPAQELARRGCTITPLPVDSQGVVMAAALPDLLRQEARLLCVMLANHETGAIQPIADLQNLLPPGVAFHCDAAAAAGKMPIDFHSLKVTTLTISAHKFHGPKGIGALLVRRDVRLQPHLFGGHQQQGRRPGTEPVHLVVGLAAALELAMQELAGRRAQVVQLRQRFLGLIREKAEPVVVNGPEEGGVPHTLNLSFPGCPADLLLMKLDLAGVACSTGSACSSGSLLPSPVLRAMGVPDEVRRSALRFSFNHLLKLAEVEEAARRLVEVVRQLRKNAG